MFRKNSLLGAALLIVAAVTGCSTVPNYYDDESLARNAIYAGGYMKVKDRSVPKGGIGDFTQTVEFGAAYTAAGFIDPALNLSNLAGGMVNMLDVLIDDGPRESRSTVFGWMPESLASNKNDAKEQIVSHVKLSITKALDEYDLNYTLLDAGSETDDSAFFAYRINSEELGCPVAQKEPEWLHRKMWNVKWLTPDACVIRASVYTPYETESPRAKLTNHPEEKSYKLSAGVKSRYNAIQVHSPKDSKLKENLIYTKISENLPEWMYIYLAPNTVSLGEDGKKIGFPYVLNQGEAHFFIRPQ